MRRRSRQRIPAAQDAKRDAITTSLVYSPPLSDWRRLAKAIRLPISFLHSGKKEPCSNALKAEITPAIAPKWRTEPSERAHRSHIGMGLASGAGVIQSIIEHNWNQIVSGEYEIPMSKMTKKAKKTAVRPETPRLEAVGTEVLKTEPVGAEPLKAKPAAAEPPPRVVSNEPVKAELRGTSRVSLEFLKPGARQVCVAGSFNGWKPETTPLLHAGDGRWVGEVPVKPGRHEYLFVVDGQWILDPKAKETVSNPFGGKNSVLVVSE